MMAMTTSARSAARRSPSQTGSGACCIVDMIAALLTDPCPDPHGADHGSLGAPMAAAWSPMAGGKRCWRNL